MNASAAGTQALAIGNGATASVVQGVAIGQGASVSGTARGVAVGQNASVNGDSGVALGVNAASTTGNSIAIGRNAVAGFNSSVALGYGAVTTAAMQFVLGGNEPAGYTINEAYLGGVTLPTVHDFTINAPGASGTDLAGGNLILAGGKGTGLGKGGALIFQTASAAGLTGSGLNTPTERMRIDANGNVGLGVSSNINSKLTFAASTTATGGILFGTDTNLYRSAAGALTTDGLFTAGNGSVIGSGGTQIKKHISSTTTWDPPSVATGSAASTTVTLSGVAVGDVVTVGFSQSLPDGVLISGSVSAANTVKVTIGNLSGAPVDLAAGTLRGAVSQY